MTKTEMKERIENKHYDFVFFKETDESVVCPKCHQTYFIARGIDIISFCSKCGASLKNKIIELNVKLEEENRKLAKIEKERLIKFKVDLFNTFDLTLGDVKAEEIWWTARKYCNYDDEFLSIFELFEDLIKLTE